MIRLARPAVCRHGFRGGAGLRRRGHGRGRARARRLRPVLRRHAVCRRLNRVGIQPQQIILIECPRLLFPFARQIVAEVTNSGGFPPLLIDPVDFVSLYRQRLMQQQAAAVKADTQ